MTSKEKAKDLISKMYSKNVKSELEKLGFNKNEIHRGLIVARKKAIERALVVADEMLDFRNGLYMNEGSLAHEYLIEVKKEIEKQYQKL